MLPTTKTAIMMAVAHTSAADHAERSDAKVTARVAAGQKALKTKGRLPSLSGERHPASYPSGQQEATRGAYGLVGWSVTNPDCRESSLGRRATSMCASKGRVRPDMLESLMSYFANPSELAGRIYASFLPEKVSEKQATALVPTLTAHVRMLPPTAKEIAALIRSVNPGSGRAGGRPRKGKPPVPGAVWVKGPKCTKTGVQGSAWVYPGEHDGTFGRLTDTASALTVQSLACGAPREASTILSTPAPMGTGTRAFGAGATNVAALLDAFYMAALRQSVESCAK